MKEERQRLLFLAPLGALVALVGMGVPGAAAEGEKERARRIDGLISVFRDPEARGEHLHLSGRAINELAAIGKPAVPRLMKAMLSTHDTVAGYSGLALDKMGAKAVPQVRAEWRKLKEATKWKFMDFLGKYDYKPSVGFALASLRSKDKEVRRQAIRYLCRHKEVRARSDLLKMLNTDDPDLRWELVGLEGDRKGGLANMPNEEVMDAFVALLAPGTWAALGKGLRPDKSGAPILRDGRRHVIFALGRMHAKRAAPALLKLLQETGPKAYRGDFILPLLGEWQYTPAIPELRRMLVADSKLPDAGAAEVLWQMKDRSGWLVLFHNLKAKNVWVRRSASAAFARYADKADVWALASCLDDKDWGVRAAACRGLERITGVKNRAPNRESSSEDDAPLWKAWYEKHKAEWLGGK